MQFLREVPEMKEWAVKILVSAMSVLMPIQGTLLTVGVLIFADLITGVWAARKRGEAITSAMLRRSVSKILVYHLVVITGFLVDTYLTGGLIPIAKLAGSVIGLVELTSIMENSNTILGRNIFKSIIVKLGSDNDPTKKL